MKIKFWRMTKMGNKWGLVRWVLGGSILYPVLCYISLIMTMADFVIPVPSSSPPQWYQVIIANIGRDLYDILFWPFLQSSGRFYVEGLRFWILPAGLGLFIGASLWVVRRFILSRFRISR